MSVFQLDPVKIKKQLRNIVILYSAVSFVFILLFVLFVVIKGFDLSLFLFLMVLLGLMVYTAMRSIKQRKRFFLGYKLEVGEDSLSQSQVGYKDLIIQKQELDSILESKFGMILSTKSARHILGITKNLSDQDYQQVRKVLFDWLSDNLSGK